MTYKKHCKVCNKEFKIINPRQDICSFDCRIISNQARARLHWRLNRKRKKKYKPCVICGFNTATKPCFQGGKSYILCPNHRALIIQEGKTVKELSK